ncbi:hypothetical protein FGE12_26810 [Aggregicoccus sp. 17bor-14]|uniref:hypothetical protein n=1 Tax=Myxococcaceae TaxID=31 RepID=UPI00129C57A5|nr:MULTISPECIES: hypothetical protein [Myxococcaceae]MBF5046054.1 hypothetical protein [Simulacricoccus sp. 17bor-14]MRI91784.1 hypothetical protein [Aggregicoccus sp. 17bor-14]
MADQLVEQGGRVFFSAEQGRQGRQLWTLPVAVLTDFTAPDPRCPADVVLDSPAAEGAVATYAPSQSAEAVQLSYSQVSGSRFVVGTTAAEVTARDLSGNSAR